MADKLKKELSESVAYFEQILSVLPTERTALEFLCVTCKQLGDMEKFLRHALTLTDVIVREQDAQGAEELVEKLQDCDDPRAKKAIVRLQVVMGPKPALEVEQPELNPSAALPSYAVVAEKALLERLIAEGILTRSLVQPVFDQLTAAASAEGGILVSALAILEKENIQGAAEAIATVADLAHAPPVPLEAFDLVPGDIQRLPRQLVLLRGTLPFCRLGGEWGVVTLNPLDGALLEEVEAAMGAKCHFFLAPPSRIEQVLDRLYAGGLGDGGR